MRKQTKTALKAACVEKDVENAYRAEVTHHRQDATWTSPHGTDGQAEWPAAAGTVRLLLEAKYDQDLKSKIPMCNVLGQILLYLKKFEQAGDVLPNVLFVGDKDECFVLSTDAVRGFLQLDLDWSVAPSKGSPELTRALVQGFNLLPYVYDVQGDLDFKDVLQKVETLAKGAQHQARATVSNLGAIFLYWRDRVFTGKGAGALTSTEQVDVFLRCLFQPNDVYLHPKKHGILVVPGYPEGVCVSVDSYRSFFDHFAQGYKPSEVEVFYAMKDRLVEDDARRRQGAFFTPALWVAEAHKELDRVLGPTWRKDCVVWDPAAGTANLTRDYNDWGCLISSTAERPDVGVMKDQGWGGHYVFQYDFLNPGSESPFFETGDRNVIPDAVDKTLRAAAKAGKRLVFFMNPPYGTASNAGTEEGDHKAGIALTVINGEMKKAKLGASTQQLYAQFMYRCKVIVREYGFQDSTVSQFSTPTFMSSGSYRHFRDWWYNCYVYAGGFLFQASHFADVSGAWGIAFTVWNSGIGTDKMATLPIMLKDERDFNIISTGNKDIYNSDGREASEWVREPIKSRGTIAGPQMSSGLRVRDNGRGTEIPNSFFYMTNGANSIYKSRVAVYLTTHCSTVGNGFSVQNSNFRRAVALYGARKLVLETWDTQKDEYLRPNVTLPGYEQWVDDCHVYVLTDAVYNNCTAMRDVQYKGKPWRIKNHWFWRSREDTLKALDTKDTPTLYRDCKAEPVRQVNEDDIFESILPPDEPWELTGDAYMAHIRPSLKLSPDAQHVLDLIDALWIKSLPVREAYAQSKPELHLTTWDAGIYQLKHLWRDLFPEEWKTIQEAHRKLAARLQDGVYTYGFLKGAPIKI